MKKIVLFIFLCLSISVGAKDYRASMFGIKSDGIVMNTRSIQKAIDFIHEKGGGELQFSVGRYITGSIHLKSNVTIRLNEGAILVGSLNPYDYDRVEGTGGFILGYEQENIAIVGKGVLDARGYEMCQNWNHQIHMGFIHDPRHLNHDRGGTRPNLLYLLKCKNIRLEGITITNSPQWTVFCDLCTSLVMDNIHVNSNNYWNNDGLDIVDCKQVKILNSQIIASDDAVCLKSHHADGLSEDIEVRNCKIQSSASAIKFGTVTRGNFKNIRFINNTVYDTYRSAITIASVDGSCIEDILVDSLFVKNTGNVIFLRTGKRWAKAKKGYIRNVTIQNVFAEVPATKPDAGYPYEGPVEDMPRNISPASIVGSAGVPIENITLRNINITYPGGGNKNFAYRGTSAKQLALIPEMEDSYPEFSQFKELPAWGLFVRHANGLIFEDIHFIAKARDYRPAIVLDDVNDVTFSSVKYTEPGSRKKQVVENKCSNIQMK